MTEITHDLEVDANELRFAINVIETTPSNNPEDRPELHCDSGKLIIRQGHTIRPVSCVGSFPGTYSIAVSSAAKWKRICNKLAGAVRIRIDEKRLSVGRLSLPVKWSPNVREIPVDAPRVVIESHTTANNHLPLTVNEAPNGGGQPIRTSVDFRVNVATKQLAAVLAHFTKTGNEEDLYLRTWNGDLVIESYTSEIRVEAVGKIKGFAVVPASELRSIKDVEVPATKYTTLACKKRVVRCFGRRLSLKRTAIPLSDLRPTGLAPKKMRMAKVAKAKPNSAIAGKQTSTSLAAILGLPSNHTNEELANMGLLEAVVAAQRKRDYLLEEAVAVLHPLGITRKQLDELVDKSMP